MDKIKEALEAYQRCNPISHDLDAYLHALGRWALFDDLKPSPEDYGLPSPNKGHKPDAG